MKKPKKKGHGVCSKCGKWYASWQIALGHQAGHCDKIKDARELYDFETDDKN